MSGPLNSYSVWRTTSDHQLDLSNSTNASSNMSQSLDSLISEQSSTALNSSLSGFDIASLIQSAGFLGAASQHRSISAPAAYRVPRTISTGLNLPTIHQQHRVPLELFNCGLTPPPSPTCLKKQEFDHLIPSPKRQNSQPSPTHFETFKGLPSIALSTAAIVTESTTPSSFGKREVEVEDTKQTETKEGPPERTTRYLFTALCT